MQENTIPQRTVLLSGIAILLLLTVIFSKQIILGKSSDVSLSTAPEFTGQIAQAYATKPDVKLPVKGKDYSIRNSVYFNDKEWVSFEIHWLNSSSNDGIIIMKKESGIYHVVLGPSTLFPRTVTETLPTEVSVYLDKIGALYDPS